MATGPDLQLRGAGDLDALIDRSSRETAVLFKHSTACPISAQAHRELHRFLAGRTGAEPFVALVRVIEERPISQEVARRLGVPHESPQAIVLRGGAAVRTLSHGAITADALRDATA